MKIGYVGLGAMGGALCRWLLTDHEVRVRDLNPEAMERLEATGAIPAASLSELARESEVIFLCLPRSKDVEAAIFGPGGLSDGLGPGKIVIDQSSGVAAETRSMAARLADRGVDMLDAPVAGGVPNAVAGTITVMVSGPDAALTRVRPAFEAMTTRIYRAGDTAGDAQSVKTLNNMANMAMRVATLELAALGVRLGVPLATLTKTLEAGTAGNFTCRTVLPAIVEGRSTGDFALTLMLKDNNQALALGMEAGVPMPLSALARGVLQQNINISGPQSKLDDVMSFMAQATGVDYLGTFDAEGGQGTANLVITALAACNRAISYEIFTLAERLGMQIEDVGTILNNGSAWSRECEAVLAERAGSGPAPARTIGDTVAALQALDRLNVPLGVATIMSGQVRAIYETALRRLGADAPVSALADLYQLGPNAPAPAI